MYFKITSIIIVNLLFILNPLLLQKKATQQTESHITEWIISDLLKSNKGCHKIVGTPKIVQSKYGDAVWFNGETDGIFLNNMPLNNLKQFTIEILFYPESGGNFEQRFLHFGSIRDHRILFETRTTATNWYFDAFIQSEGHKKALIDSTLLHPLNNWYHLALVVKNGEITTYVDGKEELKHKMSLFSIDKGITSIGVRQNKVSWFKGMIYHVIISHKALNINNFHLPTPGQAKKEKNTTKAHKTYP